MGHLLGIGHVGGTIMREDLVENMSAWFKDIPLERSNQFAYAIDYDKELYFAGSHGSMALAPLQLKPTADQKELLRVLLGVDVEQPLHMGFIQEQDVNLGKARLYVGYEGGASLPTPRLRNGGYSNPKLSYLQTKALKGKVFPVTLHLGTMIRFSTSDAPIFRVIYRGKEYSKEVPGYLIQGEINLDSGKSIPIVYGRNKGGGEYIRLSALLNNREIPFFKAFLRDQPYW